MNCSGTGSFIHRQNNHRSYIACCESRGRPSWPSFYFSGGVNRLNLLDYIFILLHIARTYQVSCLYRFSFIFSFFYFSLSLSVPFSLTLSAFLSYSVCLSFSVSLSTIDSVCLSASQRVVKTARI